MSSEWRNTVNQIVGIERIQDINSYFEKVPNLAEAPIDIFYKETKELIRTATPEFLQNHPRIGPLMAVGIVSETENYFRNLFSEIINLCPLSKEKAADQNVNLGSILWYSKDSIGRGAFENISFADAKSIISCSKKYIAFNIDVNSDLNNILYEYDKVCEMRHAIVHSGRILAGKNALKLKIDTTDDIIKINIGYPELQEITSICTTLVACYNIELFEKITERWAVKWRQLPFWTIDREHNLFKTIWSIFYSKNDATNNTIQNNLSCIKCKNIVKKTIIGN